jgi:hypothetical protein
VESIVNKKLFMSATALTAVAVAGVVYYRHEILEQLDKLRHHGAQEPTFEEYLGPGLEENMDNDV